jgi:hypothetical protein
MDRLITFLFMSSLIFVFCITDYQNNPEKGSDKAFLAVINYNKRLVYLEDSLDKIEPITSDVFASKRDILAKEHDDTYYINKKGDSTLQAFEKQVINTSHVDRKPDIGIRYKSRKNGWSYYIVRETKDIYFIRYITMEGENAPLWYRVNLSTSVIEQSGF